MRSRMFLPYALFAVLFVIAVCSIIATGGPGGEGSSAPASGPFQSTDIGGTWALVDGNATITSYGSPVISTTGAVTGGSWTTIGAGPETFMGGTVSLSSQGAISGAVSTSSGNTHTVFGGQMSLNKDLLIYHGFDALGNREVGLALRVNGSYATADLAGTWSWGTINSYGTFVVDTSGNITGGTYTVIGIGPFTVTGGTLAITAQGSISGSLTTSEPTTLTIQNGQMNSDKNVIYLAYTSAAIPGYGPIVAIKQSSSFTPGTDMAGTYWFACMTNSNSDVYGSITVNGAGTVTAGSYIDNTVGPATFTGGTLSISTQGAITGSVSTSSGNMLVLQSGQMNSSKTVAVLVDSDILANTEICGLVRTP